MGILKRRKAKNIKLKGAKKMRNTREIWGKYWKQKWEKQRKQKEQEFKEKFFGTHINKYLTN